MLVWRINSDLICGGGQSYRNQSTPLFVWRGAIRIPLSLIVIALFERSWLALKLWEGSWLVIKLLSILDFYCNTSTTNVQSLCTEDTYKHLSSPWKRKLPAKFSSVGSEIFKFWGVLVGTGELLLVCMLLMLTV